MGGKSDTTLDLTDALRRDSAAARRLSAAALALAYGEEGRRPPEWRRLAGDTVLLGRDAPLFDGGPVADPSISRRHAELSRVGTRWELRDLGSRNGCHVNGVRIGAPVLLSAGDVVRYGRTLLVFAAAPDEPAAPPTPGLVGESAALRVVRRALHAVAPHPHAVLVTGETGTGKDVVAAALHAASGRRGPFVPVNCGAIPGGVLGSELFGHARGAFTGATEARAGLFRQADGGTLFLDEIGEMPADLQVALLRVLEAGTVRPVGGERDVSIDVRVVAATNRDPVAAVRSGAFRADLYARLCSWRLHVPPLRERREDIPWLVDALLPRAGAAGRRPDLDFCEALLLQPWPLNVRGLLHVLTTAALSAPPGPDLPLTEPVRAALDEQAALVACAAPSASDGPAAPSTPAREQIVAALRSADGNMAAAARALGLSRQQLYRLVRAGDLDPDAFRPDGR